MSSEVDVALALDFLRALYVFTPPRGWLNLFSVDHSTGERSVGWAPLSDLERLVPYIEHLGARGDVWFGVAPRRERLDGGRRGGTDDCLSIPGVWLDVDVAGPGHKSDRLPRTVDDARRLLASPFNPDAVVNSGYGYQCWWRAPRAIPADMAMGMLAKWHHRWKTAAERLGFHLDNVSNVDRVMRLPGTINWKRGDQVPVTLQRQRWE
jgi:hypothetical protein